jgi:hypothetical protein
MRDNRRDVLAALKFEFGFLELGGYGRSVREPRKELSIFQDSPSCLNYAAPVRTHSCAECWLIHFVPPEKRGESVPCHHIPLNDRGDTVESLAGAGDDCKVQEAMREWLREAIGKIERQPAELQTETP